MPDLPPMIEGLLLPDAYAERPASVELLQTHISYLLLTPAHVYKIKKPVDFGFLDFTTLERRRYFCQQELTLNQRISPDIYLDVVEVRRDGSGRYTIGGPGETVEYAVKMVRLPQDRIMSSLLQRGQVDEEQVADLARLVAGFHQRAATSPEISEIGSLATLKFNADENFEQTANVIGVTITQKQYDTIRAVTDAFFTEQRALLERRIAEGRIRDCHGDLHLGQIFLTDAGVKIIDCIEFQERFRYSDVAADIAFTAMDLDYLGRHDLTRVLMDAYVEATGDRETLDLLDYYTMYRAYVRGKVDGFQLADEHIPADVRETVRRRAAGYFDLAYRYARRGKDVRLLAVGGLVGTGKSTLAAAIGSEAGAAVLSSDVVRKRLAGLAPTEHRPDAFGQGLYAPEMTERTYAELFRLARGLLADGYSVVLDATFLRDGDRAAAAALAGELDVPFTAIFCTASEDVVRQRLTARASDLEAASDGDWRVYEAQRRDHPQGYPGGAGIRVIDTAQGTVAEQVQRALG